MKTETNTFAGRPLYLDAQATTPMVSCSFIIYW